MFDIGANLGNRTRIFLALGASVVAIEPQPRCTRGLAAAFGSSERFVLLEKAVGAEPGTATLHVSDSHTLSTLSDEWISAMTSSGRFGAASWLGEHEVEMTTLDAVIAEFGAPDFVKIDVEGYEAQVLAGLSTPLDAGSIEFAAEALDTTFVCVERLLELDAYEFQFALGERPAMSLSEWTSDVALRHALRAAQQADPRVWGDVYFSRRTQARH